MSPFRLRLLAALGLSLAATCVPAVAQGVDPADMSFWQSIKNSNDPAEYQAYLESFPEGEFAELAQVRLKALQLAAGAENAASDDGPADPGDNGNGNNGDALSEAVITVTPAAPRVGNEIKVSTSNMPTPSVQDSLIVVAAGTPDSVDAVFKPGVIKWDYAQYNANGQKDWSIGSLPPGSYEVRWLTNLYNTEGRLEIGARKAFKVGR